MERPKDDGRADEAPTVCFENLQLLLSQFTENMTETSVVAQIDV